MAMLQLLSQAVGLVAQPVASECKRFDDREKGVRQPFLKKVITVAGPNTGTWTATVVVGATPDGKGWSPSVKTYNISNAVPFVDEVLETPFDNWGAWITAYTGDASALGTNGRRGIDVMVNA